jgi:hypothetical protein
MGVEPLPNPSAAAPAAALIVTIDTEADSMWDRPKTLGFRNTRGLAPLQAMLEGLGVRPTYLTTYEVASDPESAARLRSYVEEGRAEVGAHLHAWSNPPFRRIAQDEDRVHPYPHDYDRETFEAKLDALREELLRKIGVEARTYRAGRWGFVAEHGVSLRERGFLADTSVTPGVSWERHPGARADRGGPSYRGAPREPYRLSAEDATRSSLDGLLEVPVSIEWNRPLGPLEPWADRLHPYGPVARVLRASRILRPVWLRPYRRFRDTELRALVDRLARRRRPVYNVMFHSSEATAGTSPYARTDAELAVWFHKLRVMLERALAHGARPMTLSEFAQEWLRATTPTGGIVAAR